MAAIPEAGLTGVLPAPAAMGCCFGHLLAVPKKELEIGGHDHSEHRVVNDKGLSVSEGD